MPSIHRCAQRPWLRSRSIRKCWNASQLADDNPHQEGGDWPQDDSENEWGTHSTRLAASLMSGGWKTDISAAPDSLKEELNGPVRTRAQASGIRATEGPGHAQLARPCYHLRIIIRRVAADRSVGRLAARNGPDQKSNRLQFRPSRSSAGCLLPSLSRRCR